MTRTKDLVERNMKCSICSQQAIYSGEKLLCSRHFKAFEKYKKAKEEMLEALREVAV